MVIVVSVMFRFACSLLCYVVLYSVIMFYLLVFPFICLCLLLGHVDVGDVHTSQYAMLNGYDSLLIWWIVMWYPHDYVDIMFMHFIMAQYICIQVNRIKLNLNNCWLSHCAVELSWPVQPRFPIWDGPNWVYCRASRRCLQWGKVMGVLYPGPVSRHNLVCLLLIFWIRVP